MNAMSALTIAMQHTRASTPLVPLRAPARLAIPVVTMESPALVSLALMTAFRVVLSVETSLSSRDGFFTVNFGDERN